MFVQRAYAYKVITLISRLVVGWSGTKSRRDSWKNEVRKWDHFLPFLAAFFLPAFFLGAFLATFFLGADFLTTFLAAFLGAAIRLVSD